MPRYRSIWNRIRDDTSTPSRETSHERVTVWMYGEILGEGSKSDWKLSSQSLGSEIPDLDAPLVICRRDERDVLRCRHFPNE
jgi:hypothetical protein